MYIVHVSKTRCAWNANVDNMLWFKIPGKAWEKDCIPCRLVSVFTYVTNRNKKYYLESTKIMSTWSFLTEIHPTNLTQPFCVQIPKNYCLSQNSTHPQPILHTPNAVSWAPRHRSTSQTSRISICTSDNHRTIAIIFNLSCATRMLWIALDRRGRWKRLDLERHGRWWFGAGYLLQALHNPPKV